MNDSRIPWTYETILCIAQHNQSFISKVDTYVSASSKSLSFQCGWFHLIIPTFYNNVALCPHSFPSLFVARCHSSTDFCKEQNKQRFETCPPLPTFASPLNKEIMHFFLKYVLKQYFFGTPTSL